LFLPFSLLQLLLQLNPKEKNELFILSILHQSSQLIQEFQSFQLIPHQLLALLQLLQAML
jgi:hypothetical protein